MGLPSPEAARSVEMEGDQNCFPGMATVLMGPGGVVALRSPEVSADQVAEDGGNAGESSTNEHCCANILSDSSSLYVRATAQIILL